MGGNQSTENFVDIGKIYEVKDGYASQLADNSKVSPKKYNENFLTVEQQNEIDIIVKNAVKKMENEIIAAAEEEFKKALLLSTSYAYTNQQILENDPVLRESTLVARLANTKEDQEKLMIERQKTISKTASKNSRFTPRRYAKLIYKTFNFYFEEMAKDSWKFQAYVASTGIDRYVTYKICRNTGLSLQGIGSGVLCMGAGVSFLVLDEGLRNDIRTVFQGLKSPEQSLKDLAFYKNVSIAIKNQLVPKMKAINDIKDMWNFFGVPLIDKMDAGLEFLQRIPANSTGVIMVGEAVGKYISVLLFNAWKFGKRAILESIKAAKNVAIKVVKKVKTEVKKIKNSAQKIADKMYNDVNNYFNGLLKVLERPELKTKPPVLNLPSNYDSNSISFQNSDSQISNNTPLQIGYN